MLLWLLRTAGQLAPSSLYSTMVLGAAASPAGPFGTINYTKPYGPINAANISILGLPNLAFASTGPIFGEVVTISDM